MAEKLPKLPAVPDFSRKYRHVAEVEWELAEPALRNNATFHLPLVAAHSEGVTLETPTTEILLRKMDHPVNQLSAMFVRPSLSELNSFIFNSLFTENLYVAT